MMKKISLRKSLMGLLLIGLVFMIGTVKADDISNKVEVSSIDSETKEAVSGSTLAIADSAGNIIDEWVSSADAHYVYNLSVGEYTLYATSAADGYNIDSSMIFSVCEDDKIISLTMENTKINYVSDIVSVPSTSSSNSVMYLISLILIVVGSLLAYNYANLKNE